MTKTNEAMMHRLWAPTVSLAGREARCSCGTIKPSSPELPFFDYLGPQSPDSRERCVCGKHMVAHCKVDPSVRISNNATVCKNGGFKPRGAAELDTFYCGHDGWD